MPFNETNYRRLRADLVGLLSVPDQFDWSNGRVGNDPGCVACRCVALDTALRPFCLGTWAPPKVIKAFIGCHEREAEFLYYASQTLDGVKAWGVTQTGIPAIESAIQKLDEVAARYGVTAESPASDPASAFTLTPAIESQFLAACRLTASQPVEAEQ